MDDGPGRRWRRRLEKPNEPKVATALLQATELDGVRELSAGHGPCRRHGACRVVGLICCHGVHD